MADDLDKTVVFDEPDMDDKTVVMKRDTEPVDNDKTMVYADNDKAETTDDDKTVVYGGDDKTLVGMADNDSSERTMRPEGAASRNNTNELAANMFNLKGLDYEQVTCLSDNSGEAQVYLVRREGREYVLKLYYPNFDINKKLLQLVRSFQFEMIVDLQDYGRTYVDGKNRYYELMEYLKGGTLKDVKINGDFNRFRRLTMTFLPHALIHHHDAIIAQATDNRLRDAAARCHLRHAWLLRHRINHVRRGRSPQFLAGHHRDGGCRVLQLRVACHTCHHHFVQLQMSVKHIRAILHLLATVVQTMALCYHCCAIAQQRQHHTYCLH